MITFLEYQNIEDIYHYIITKHNLDKAVIFSIGNEIDKSSIIEWSALDQLGGDSIFDEGEKIHLVDVSNVNISSRINTVNTDSSVDIYLYNPDQRKLNASDKKLMKKAGIRYQKMSAIDKPTLKEYIEHTPEAQTIDNQLLESIYQSHPTLFGFYNCLQTISLIDPQTYLKSIEQTKLKPLYMQPVFPGNKSNITLWYNQIHEDEIQLNISLLHTKLKKNHTGESKLKELINLDKNIKTISTTKPVIWYKYFLWQLTQ